MLESKLIYSKIVDSTLSRTIATLQLKRLYFNGDIIKLIVDSPTIENLIQNNTLAMLDLYGLIFLSI